MKVTLNWLREFVPIAIDPFELAARLTMGGLEVEGIEQIGSDMAGVIVGEIVSTRPHPNAERLTVCEVRSGPEAAVAVVCGATNMKAGDRVAYAPPGTTLPGDRRIDAREIRGIRSMGMLCSEAELGISDEAAGILILAVDAPLGDRVARYLAIEDTVFDISVTPNRGDCLSVLGIAREVAVLTGAKLRRLRTTVRERGTPTAGAIKVRIEGTTGCGRYAARLVRGVSVRPSPRWMQARLSAVGVRPINNVVDVTNFVMVERGQPLHAFDYDRLPCPEIVVRDGRPSDVLRTLDGIDRELGPQDVLITTGEKAVAIGGVMGGEGSEVSLLTRNVLLEAAWFEPARVRRTAGRLGLETEAAYRFERGVDVDGVVLALNRAAQLLEREAGGEVAEGVVDVYPSPAPRAPIHVRLRRVEDILGIRTNRSEVVNVLKALGAGVSSGPHGSLSVVPASFRSDLSREIDVIEEVARVTGYHRIPATLPEVRVQGGEIPEHMRCVREIKRLLAAQGLYETISMSFTSPAMNETFPGIGTAGEAVEIVNPLGRDESQLRRSLLGELAAIVRFNRSRETKNVAAFSVGKVFWRTGTTQEGWRVAGALAGEVPKLGLRASRPSDFTDIKGIVESLLDHVHFRVDGRWECSRDAAFHPGRSAWLRVDDRVVAVTGSLHPEVEERLELHENSWFFELDLDTVLSYRQPRSIFRELPRFPAVVRDVAIIVDEDFAADRVVRFVRESKRELVEDVTLFDEYFGEPMPAGKKSLAYSISYRAPDRTLTDEEVNEVHGALISALSRELNIELRS